MNGPDPQGSNCPKLASNTGKAGRRPDTGIFSGKKMRAPPSTNSPGPIPLERRRSNLLADARAEAYSLRRALSRSASGCDRLDRGEIVGPLGFERPQVVGTLHAKPDLGIAADKTGKAERHRRGDGSLLAESGVEPGPGDAEPLGDRGLRKTERRQNVLAKQFAGMRGTESLEKRIAQQRWSSKSTSQKSPSSHPDRRTCQVSPDPSLGLPRRTLTLAKRSCQ